MSSTNSNDNTMPEGNASGFPQGAVDESVRQMDRIDRIAAAERAVLMKDSARALDFSRRLAEAGQKAAGLELGEPTVDDEMIIGDVTINTTTNAPSTSTTEAVKSGVSDIGKMVAIAGASALLGGAVPAGIIAAGSLFGKDQNPPAVIELEDTDTRNSIGIFRPEANQP